MAGLRSARVSRPDRRATQAPTDGEASPRRRSATRIALLGVCGALVLVAAGGIRPGSNASADPSAADWHRLRVCESGNNYAINTGNGHYGAYQFDLATWRSVGGSSFPYLAAPAEQDARALILYRMRGWQPWQCARIVGLHEDADARSGRISDIHVPTHGSGGTPPSSHAWPGVYYTFGDHSAGIRQWQLKMKSRGAPLTGSGQFGPNTLAVVKRIQLLNHLRATGILGPNTWALAWNGRYTNPPPAKPVKRPPTRKPVPAPVKKPAPHRAVVAPPWTAPQYYSLGDHSNTIRRWQLKMKSRGAPLTGSGQFGPRTLAIVKRIQWLNHLRVTGILGPVTWRLAWTGRY